MPPLIKGATSESTEDIDDLSSNTCDPLDSVSDHHTSNNVSIGVCEAPHPIDRIVWRNVAIMIYLHALGLYGMYVSCFAAQWKTVITGESADHAHKHLYVRTIVLKSRRACRF